MFTGILSYAFSGISGNSESYQESAPLWEQIEETRMYAEFRCKAIEKSTEITAVQFESYLSHRLRKVVSGVELPSEEIETLIKNMFFYKITTYPFDLLADYKLLKDRSIRFQIIPNQ